MNFNHAHFLLSVHALRQLPEDGLPEIAFAGRSNVGKSSLINSLTGRKGLVKTSSVPGKTRGLNFFSIDGCLHLVDLPGYGFARVAKSMQDEWGALITAYLENRAELACVVIILDLRHELKTLDRDMIAWLRERNRVFLPVYTKADKLAHGQQLQHASRLDAALTLSPGDRIIFSSKTGQGKEELRERLAILEKGE